MYLYNISIILEDAAHQEALRWIRTSYLPSLPVSGSPFQLLVLKDSPHEGFTYCLQAQFQELSARDEFRDTHLAVLQEYLVTNHPNQAFLLDSTMQYLPL